MASDTTALSAVSALSLGAAARANLETGVLLLCKEALITAIQDRRLERGHLRVLAAIEMGVATEELPEALRLAGRTVRNLLSELRSYDYVSGYRGHALGPDRGDLEFAVWNKTDGRCTYCTCKLNPFDRLAPDGFHVDHAIPKTHGGGDSIHNLVPSCRRCNLSKSARTFDQWGGHA